MNNVNLGRLGGQLGIGLDALSGTDAFIMKGDGKGWLFVPAGLVDGPGDPPAL